MTKSGKSSGFTLIEFAIVIAISGMIMAAGTQLYSVYLKSKVQSSTYESMDKFNGAITGFFSQQNRYPCPADPSLPDTDPDAGIEKCNVALAVGTCSGGANVGVCKTLSVRDADNSGAVDQILIGAIPYKTLKIAKDDLFPQDGDIKNDMADCNASFVKGLATAPPCTNGVYMISNSTTEDLNVRNSFDSWGNRFTYAVSSLLTSPVPGTFDFSYGGITVQTENGTQLTEPPASAMWVLVSHGEDGVGAYSLNGRRSKACAGVSKDVENCDNDSIFVNGIRIMSPGATYYDDLTTYSVQRISSLWSNTTANSTTGTTTDDITNRNIGNVGIGTAAVTPAERLDIAGNLKASRVQSNLVCNFDGTQCFDLGRFGSAAGVVCSGTPLPGHARAVTGIRNGGVHCDDIPLTVIVPNTCTDPLKNIVGFDGDGEIICE